MKNEYGLDVHYFNKNLKKIMQEIDCYTPEEMHRALIRLAEAARPTKNREKYPRSSHQ